MIIIIIIPWIQRCGTGRTISTHVGHHCMIAGCSGAQPAFALDFAVHLWRAVTGWSSSSVHCLGNNPEDGNILFDICGHSLATLSISREDTKQL